MGSWVEADGRKGDSESSQVRVGGGLDKVWGGGEGIRDRQRLGFPDDWEGDCWVEDKEQF